VYKKVLVEEDDLTSFEMKLRKRKEKKIELDAMVLKPRYYLCVVTILYSFA
jgi:hypothetical protein